MLPKRRDGMRLPPAARLPLAVVLLAALVSPAGAVPVPYKNCGKPGDILAVQQLTASVWPPATAAPLAGIATLDPVTGQLTNLRVFLLLGVYWTFDSGSLATGLASGFVPLPASVPVAVTAPPLPVLLGPYTVSHTFSAPRGGSSVVVVSKANFGQTIDAAVTHLSLTFNGASGFPVPPLPGNYEARVQMVLPGGAEIFCFDLSLADISFVTAAPATRIPTLPTHYGLPLLLFLLATFGLRALRRRR